MGAKNMVIAGDYANKPVSASFGEAYIANGFKTIYINKENVAEYERIDQEQKVSATSAVGRAFVGSMILGPAGLLAGLSAKKKGIHTVAIQFKDGTKSLMEVDDKLYKVIMAKLF